MPGSLARIGKHRDVTRLGNCPMLLRIPVFVVGRNAMADKLPEEITRKELLEAINDLDQSLEHRFSESTGYDVLHQGKPPKQSTCSLVEMTV